MPRPLSLERLGTYTLEQLGSSADALDGPFVTSSGGFGLLVSLRGKDGGAMPSPSTVRWGRNLPPALAAAPCQLFLRRDDGALYLGLARVQRKGSLARDGLEVEFVLDEPPDEVTWRDWVAEASAPPPPAPEAALAALTRDSTTEQRLAALDVFLERWFGPRTGAPTSSSPASHGIAVPDLLRMFYARTEGRALCVQNQLVPAARLAADADGCVAFYVENQGVYAWACASARVTDPPVYVRGPQHTAPWQLEAEHLSSFLAQLVVLECTFGARLTAHHDALDTRGFSRLRKHVRPLALPAWKITGTRFFGQDAVIGFAVPNGPDWSVWLGASDRRRVERLTPLVGDWPHVCW